MTPSQSIPQQTDALFNSMARAAEENWKGFSETRNGQTIIHSSDMPVEERIKGAFMFGDIMAQTGLIASFTQDGLNNFILPNRRVRWHFLETIKLEPGQKMEDIFFVEQVDAESRVHQGSVTLVQPEPDLLNPEEAPRPPFLAFQRADGTQVINVVGWIDQHGLLSTFNL